MNFLNANSIVIGLGQIATTGGVCAVECGTVAACAAAEGDTMSSEGWGG